MAQQASKIPKYPFMTHLMTRGTYYDVGYNVGLAFSQPTKLFFAESKNFRQNLLPFYDSQAGRDYYEESLRACQDCYPQYVREIRGMADGTGLPFEHIFLENISSEINAIIIGRPKPENKKPENKKPESSSEINQATTNSPDKDSCDEPPEFHPDSIPPGSSFPDNIGCTDVLINRPGHQLMLHNEDSYPLAKRYGYLLSAEIEEEEEEGLQREQFTSFCCPGSLPGWTSGYNVHGLAITIDWLCPRQVVRQSPGRVFVCRALMRARDIQEAVGILKNAPGGVAYGFCANIFSSKEERMVSVEVGPGKPEGLVHVYDVTQQNDPDAPCHYYHFNAYKHLTQVPEFAENWSSVHRARRVAELPSPRTRQEALAVLADNHDPIRPIFRTPRPTDQCETVNTVVLDVLAKRMLVYQGREDMLSDRPCVELSMY